MNLDNELDAFKKIATGEDTQTQLILVTGEGGMGKSYLLSLYQQVADENKLDVISFDLGPQFSVEKCIDQIVRRLGYKHFYCYDEFLKENPHEPFSPPKEESWQRNLTRQFFMDLDNYTSVSSVAIFFDKYEKADPVFKNWLSQIFVPCISHPIIAIISGRESIEPLPSSKGCRHFPLTGVTVDWYHRYAEDCKVELDSKVIDIVHKVLKGRPKDFVEYVKGQRSQGAVQ